MIFGDKRLTDFGKKCKVTKWKSSMYSDFDRKNLTYRGRVIASCEVPTVRTVEADILVVSSSTFDLMSILRKMSKWLIDTGTDKLIAVNDTAHYYKARCTAVSDPEYEGSSAKFTATFTCTDDRIFRTIDDTPLVDNTPEMHNFSFNGKHCLNDMGCVFFEDKFDAIPKPKFSKYTLSGVSGTVRFDDTDPVYDERSLSGTLYFLRSKDDMSLMNPDDIRKKMHSISEWLISGKRSRLILDSEIDKFYEAEVSESIEFSTKDWENGYIKLKMVLQPFAESVTEYSKPNFTSKCTAGVRNNIVFPTNVDNDTIDSPLYIKIKNVSGDNITDLTIEANNTSIRFNGNGFSLGAGYSIVVDGREKDIYILDSSGNKTQAFLSIKSGRFLSFNPKDNLMAHITSNVSFDMLLAYKYRRRYI